MKNIACLILGGGKGTRLMPLTAKRSKPAVPLAGQYRLIDIPISNCINSGIRRIYLLTQFNSVSLHRHIRNTYNFDHFHGGFVEILAAEQTNEGTDWYQGTADAVRKQLRYVQQPGIDYVLILSGDQLYRMDFDDMLKTHRDAKADVTIAALPVSPDKAASFGIMRVNDTGRVEGFLEKPKTQEELDLVRCSPEWLQQNHIGRDGRDCLASMGIYLFNRDTLVDLVSNTDDHDFGKEIFPTAIRARRVQAHLFDGYWEDIGTIAAFFEANLDLAKPNSPFDLHLAEAPIYTRPRNLPPTQINGATVTSSLIANGCRIRGITTINESVVGVRSVIGDNVTLQSVVMMGADGYEGEDLQSRVASTDIPLGIGSGTVIERAIVDKNCRIGRNCVIRLPEGFPDNGECGPVVVRDRIIVIPKGAVIPDGWTFATQN